VEIEFGFRIAGKLRLDNNVDGILCALARRDSMLSMLSLGAGMKGNDYWA
jgi:hypothetical protein